MTVAVLFKIYKNFSKNYGGKNYGKEALVIVDVPE